MAEIIEKLSGIILKKISSTQLVALTFLILILIGTGLLMLPIAVVNGEPLSFIDALFTSTSASCVTGLIVEDTGTRFTWFGRIVLICLIQVGGLGIMTMTTLVAVLVGKKVSLKERLFLQESFNQGDTSGIVMLALNVIKYALVIEAAFGTLLAAHFYRTMGAEGIAFGYWHAVSAFCNAGFDLMGHYDSVTKYTDDYVVNFIIMVLIILGGMGFIVIDDIRCNRRWSKFSLHTKIVLSASFWLIVLGTAVVWGMEYNNVGTLGSMSTGDSIVAAAFQAVSARTAGFNSIDLSRMHDSTLFVMIALMFIGASPGSTGGGLKTTTFMVLLLFTWGLLHGRKNVVLFNRRVDQDTVNKAYNVFSLCIAWVLIVFLALLILDAGRHPSNFVLFETVSAFATVGLGIGVTGEWGMAAKLLLILTMYLGRVGILTVVLSFLHKDVDKIKYPSEHVNIG